MQASVQVCVFVLQQMPGLLLPNALAAAPGWLGHADQQRYLAMGSGKRRAEFVAARLLLRYALRHCYGEASDHWLLVAPAGSRPRLEGQGVDGPAPAISIAHSAGLVVCAVAALPRLGVDVERYAARRGDMTEVASATLHPLELAEMAGLAAAKRRDYFFRLWTLKEALAKALGSGLALRFRDLGFAGHRLIESPGNWEAKNEPWGFANLAVGTNAALGLAWTTKREGDMVALSVHAVEQHQLPRADSSD